MVVRSREEEALREEGGAGLKGFSSFVNVSHAPLAVNMLHEYD
jgi:hypothetical protein